MKPNICICEDGRIAPSCSEARSEEQIQDCTGKQGTIPLGGNWQTGGFWTRRLKLSIAIRWFYENCYRCYRILQNCTVSSFIFSFNIRPYLSETNIWLILLKGHFHEIFEPFLVKKATRGPYEHIEQTMSVLQKICFRKDTGICKTCVSVVVDYADTVSI